MEDWFSRLPEVYGNLLVLGVVLLVGPAAIWWAAWTDWRRRNKARTALLEEEATGGGRPGIELPFRAPWQAGPDAPQVEAWQDEADSFTPQTDSYGSSAAPTRVEVRVAVTWPDEGPTKGLRQRLQTVDPRLKPLADYLFRPDNSFPRGVTASAARPGSYRSRGSTRSPRTSWIWSSS